MKVQVTLNKKQLKAFTLLTDNKTNEVLFGGGAGGGKSYLIAVFCWYMATRYPNSSGLVARKFLKDLKDTTFVSFVHFMESIGMSDSYRLFDKDIIEFTNGSKIYLRGFSTKEGDVMSTRLGSLEVDYLCIDEAQEVSTLDKETAFTRVRGKILDQYGLINKGLYCTNPGEGWVRQQFYTPYVNGSLPPDRAFIPSLVGDNPKVFSLYKESLEKLSDQRTKRRLLYGDWEYERGSGSIVDIEKARNIPTNLFLEAVYKDAQAYITADVARFGKDKTIIRVWRGWHCIERIELSLSSITETAQAIRNKATQYSIPMRNVLVDEDGIGGGVVDILRCNGFVANRAAVNKNTTNYATIKDQCCYIMAEKINADSVLDKSKNAAHELIEELACLCSEGTDGKTRVTSKDNIKRIVNRSPDDMDTYIMRAYFEVMKKTTSIHFY